MLRKLRDICLVGSIALIGADRLDAFAGHGPFVLRPFLLLVPAILLLDLFLVSPREAFQVPLTPPLRRQMPFLFACGLFLLFSFGSILPSLDPERSFVAFSGLLLVVCSGYFLSLKILQDPEPQKLIVRAVTFGLIGYFIFCVGEVIAWRYGIFATSDPGSGSWVESTFGISTLFWVPRLAGSTLDPNRSGFLLLMYMGLLDRFTASTRYTSILRFVIAVFILLTLSRTVMLCWLAYALFSPAFWERFSYRRSAAWLGALLVGLSFAWVGYRDQISELSQAWDISEIVSDRLSGEEGSSGGEHIKLIERGVEVWAASAKTVIAGIGFGTAPKVLTDFFGEDKHSNFHCLFATVLAEIGLPAFLVLLVLLGYPIIGRRGSLPCIVAIVIFNISYQAHMEPVFWAMLALVWSLEPRYFPALRRAHSGRQQVPSPA